MGLSTGFLKVTTESTSPSSLRLCGGCKSSWLIQEFDHITQILQTRATVLGSEEVFTNCAWFEAEPLGASTNLGILVDCLLYGRINRDSTERVVVNNLDRTHPILEVLKNAWIVFWRPCHFCIIYKHKSCIVLFIICKAPWIEQANRMEMQQPISLPRCSMPTEALQGQHRSYRKLQELQCWGEAGPDTQ